MLPNKLLYSSSILTMPLLFLFMVILSGFTFTIFPDFESIIQPLGYFFEGL